MSLYHNIGHKTHDAQFIKSLKTVNDILAFFKQDLFTNMYSEFSDPWPDNVSDVGQAR